MYMYLLITMVQFAKFCTYNNLDFCSKIHNLSIHHPRATCSIEKLLRAVRTRAGLVTRIATDVRSGVGLAGRE